MSLYSYLQLLHSQIPVTKHNAKSRFFDEMNSDRVRYTKLGQSLHKRILSEHRTFEETLQHTLDYCNMYTDTLPPKVLYIDDEVKTYESDVTKRQKLKERFTILPLLYRLSIIIIIFVVISLGTEGRIVPRDL